jgi:hypothetical protein
MKPIDLTGRIFGNITVVKRDGHKGVRVAWLCHCECGKSTRSRTADLVANKTLSCGCTGKGKIGDITRTHGRSKTPTYLCWLNMKARVKPHHPRSVDYFSRGITLCDRWDHSFESFLADMGEKPVHKSLDRINNDGNYEPGNCRWATTKEQANNTRPQEPRMRDSLGRWTTLSAI